MNCQIVCTLVLLAVANTLAQYMSYPVFNPMLPFSPPVSQQWLANTQKWPAQDELGRASFGYAYPGLGLSSFPRRLIRVDPVIRAPSRKSYSVTGDLTDVTIADDYQCLTNRRKRQTDQVSYMVASQIAPKNKYPFMVSYSL